MEYDSVRITANATTGNHVFANVTGAQQAPLTLGTVGGNFFVFNKAWKGIVSCSCQGSNLGAYTIGGTASVTTQTTFGSTTASSIWSGFVTVAAGQTLSIIVNGTTTTSQTFRCIPYYFSS